MDDARPVIGILGLGAFGRLAASSLAPHARVLGHDADRSVDPPGGVERAGLADVAACPTLVLAMNLPQLEHAARAVAPHLQPGSLVIDVCSVKVEPLRILSETLPDSVQILGTHPLFGPQTVAEKGLRGQPMALCPVRIDADRMARVRALLGDRLGLRLIEIDPDEHDRQMSYVQVITHLVGHAANEMDLPELPLATLAYRRLLQLKANTRGDSEDMFQAIQRANPHAAGVRERFLRAMRVVGDRASGEPG